MSTLLGAGIERSSARLPLQSRPSGLLPGWRGACRLRMALGLPKPAASAGPATSALGQELSVTSTVPRQASASRTPPHVVFSAMPIDQSKMGQVVTAQMEALEADYGEDCQIG